MRQLRYGVLLLLLILSALWLGLFLWYQLGSNSLWTWAALPALIGLVSAIIYSHKQSHSNRPKAVTHQLSQNKSAKRSIADNRYKKLMGAYAVLWLAGAATFFLLPAKTDRAWQAEVKNILTYERDAHNPDIITLHNVRNFTWHSNLPAPISNLDDLDHLDNLDDLDHHAADNASNNEQAHPKLSFSSNKQLKQYNQKADDAIAPTTRWDSRQVDLSKLSGVDVINSYWMGEQIGHTLVSFRLSDDRPIAFSFEIRKEVGEEFSALAGFFRRYELSLIASEERDIIYTRSNWRGEQVYLLPLDNLTQAQVRELFEYYLEYADTLQARPEWYNTLINNCTNLIFNMARQVDEDKFPPDYRIWLTGYIPNYLYDNGLLPNTKVNTGNNKPMTKDDTAALWSMQTWYEHAYINPKTNTFTERDNQSMTAYSKLIRQDLPIPKLEEGNERKP